MKNRFLDIHQEQVKQDQIKANERYFDTLEASTGTKIITPSIDKLENMEYHDAGRHDNPHVIAGVNANDEYLGATGVPDAKASTGGELDPNQEY